jgi:hypothetical protein
MRLVADPSLCAPNESLVSWNQEGRKGEKGDPGTPGEPGVEGPPGRSLRVFDGAGNVLGLLGWGGLRPFNEELGLSIPLTTLRGRPELNVFFDGMNCGASSGQGYVSSPQSTGTVGLAAHLVGPYPDPYSNFFTVRTELVSSVEVLSVLTEDQCTNNLSPETRTNLLPADPFTDELPFSIPVPEPIYVDIAP